jgi:hypothetical protein
MAMKNKIFARITDQGAAVLWADSGEPVTQFDETMPIAWPIDSDLCAHYEHPQGIVLAVSDAKKIGIPIEHGLKGRPSNARKSTEARTVRLSLRITPAASAGLDRACQPGESRTDALERMLLSN